MANRETVYTFPEPVLKQMSFQEAKDLIIPEIENLIEIIDKMYINNRVVVIVKTPTDEKGTYDSFEVDVYPSFADANDFLNKEMYNTKLSISVFEYCTSDNSFVNVMDKCFNSTSYHRLAGIEKHNLYDDRFLSRVRKIYDMYPRINLYI